MTILQHKLSADAVRKHVAEDFYRAEYSCARILASFACFANGKWTINGNWILYPDSEYVCETQLLDYLLHSVRFY